jgi:hypothetical protein
VSEPLSAPERRKQSAATLSDAPAPDGAQRALEAFRRAVREAAVLTEEQVRVIVGAGEGMAAVLVELRARPPGKGKGRT